MINYLPSHSSAPPIPAPMAFTMVRHSTTPVVRYGPWMTALGLAVTVTCEVFSMPSSVTLTIELQHKDVDEADDSAADVAGASIIFNTTGAQVDSDRATGLKQLIRYKYALSGAATVGFAHLRMAALAWETN